MKIIFCSILVVSLAQIAICKYIDIGINNRFLEIICKGVFGIVFYLIVFVSVYLFIGENMFFSIGLMFVIYVVCELLGYKLLKYNDLRYKLSIVLIILIYVVFGILTYYPIHNFMFLDVKEEVYGVINK